MATTTALVFLGNNATMSRMTASPCPTFVYNNPAAAAADCEVVRQSRPNHDNISSYLPTTSREESSTPPYLSFFFWFAVF